MENQDNTAKKSTLSISDSVMIELRKIMQAIDINSKSLSKRVGLTGPQLVILRELSNLEGATVGEIARLVNLSQATVTGILERMERRSLVVKQRSDLDKRRVLVQITESGKRLLDHSPPLMQEAFVEKFNHLPTWNQTMILSSLQQLVALMDAKSIKSAPFLAAVSHDEMDN